MKGVLVTVHLGSCLCGAVSFEVRGDFDSFYLCHCQHCQKDTGSAHSANLFSQSAKLVWRSGADAVTSFTLPSSRHSKSFPDYPCCAATPMLYVHTASGGEHSHDQEQGSVSEGIEHKRFFEKVRHGRTVREGYLQLALPSGLRL